MLDYYEPVLHRVAKKLQNEKIQTFDFVKFAVIFFFKGSNEYSITILPNFDSQVLPGIEKHRFSLYYFSFIKKKKKS